MAVLLLSMTQSVPTVIYGGALLLGRVLENYWEIEGDGRSLKVENGVG